MRSYRQTLEHLRAHGVDVLEKPTNLTPWAQLYVTDPDGNVIELNATLSTISRRGTGGHSGSPASRRGKNAPPSAERWHTFIFLPSGHDLAVWEAAFWLMRIITGALSRVTDVAARSQ